MGGLVSSNASDFPAWFLGEEGCYGAALLACDADNDEEIAHGEEAIIK
jgi:hypothetical protein